MCFDWNSKYEYWTLRMRPIILNSVKCSSQESRVHKIQQSRRTLVAVTVQAHAETNVLDGNNKQFALDHTAEENIRNSFCCCCCCWCYVLPNFCISSSFGSAGHNRNEIPRDYQKLQKINKIRVRNDSPLHHIFHWIHPLKALDTRVVMRSTHAHEHVGRRWNKIVRCALPLNMEEKIAQTHNKLRTAALSLSPSLNLFFNFIVRNNFSINFNICSFHEFWIHIVRQFTQCPLSSHTHSHSPTLFEKVLVSASVTTSASKRTIVITLWEMSLEKVIAVCPEMVKRRCFRTASVPMPQHSAETKQTQIPFHDPHPAFNVHLWCQRCQVAENVVSSCSIVILSGTCRISFRQRTTANYHVHSI